MTHIFAGMACTEKHVVIEQVNLKSGRVWRRKHSIASEDEIFSKHLCEAKTSHCVKLMVAGLNMSLLHGALRSLTSMCCNPVTFFLTLSSVVGQIASFNQVGVNIIKNYQTITFHILLPLVGSFWSR